MTPLERLVEAAKAWAAFQEPDSVLDQKTDARLRVQAEVARQMLLYAIDNLGLDATLTLWPNEPSDSASVQRETSK